MVDAGRGTVDEGLRGLVWSVINLAQANQLFVHSSQLEVQHAVEGKKKVATRVVPEILVACVLNVLVPNGSMLLVGGHGGAKTTLVKLLGRMFTGASLDQIEESILRGHPQLTEEKILATLDLPRLLKGEEVVKWRTFVTSFWKVIDEVNRMTPYAQNILLSLLAEQRVRFYDAAYAIPQFTLFATMNPDDEGTFTLPVPFLDRFGFSIPFSMPTTNDLSLILKSKDTKLFGYDEFMQVPRVLSIDQLLRVWHLVDAHEVTPEAEEFIQAIVRDFSACDRINKGATGQKQVGPDLCHGCHFDTSRSVCNKVATILSVRAAKDLLRYAKALAWLLGVPVDIHVVMTVAPYVIQHRVTYVSAEIGDAPYFGDAMRFTRALLGMVRDRYAARKPAIDIMNGIKQGIAGKDAVKTLEEYGKNDPVVKQDFVPLARVFLDERYQDYLARVERAKTDRDVDALVAIKDELLRDGELLNKGELLTKTSIYLNLLTFSSYSFKFKTWRDEIWAELSSEFRGLDVELRKSLTERFHKQLRTGDGTILLTVTGNDDESDVTMDFSGGHDVARIKAILLRAGVFHDEDLKPKSRRGG